MSGTLVHVPSWPDVGAYNDLPSIGAQGLGDWNIAMAPTEGDFAPPDDIRQYLKTVLIVVMGAGKGVLLAPNALRPEMLLHT